MTVLDRLLAAGMSETAAVGRSRLFDRLDRHLDSGGELQRWFVPGRIEVLGKHTDYAGGRSLLCAVERGFAVAARPRTDARLWIDDVAQHTQCDLEISPDLELPASGWSVYPAAVARRLARDFPGGLRGADVAFASDLPLAAGLSSSSALVVAMYFVLSATNALASRDEHRSNIGTIEDLAGYLGCVENGMPFGSLRGGSGVGTFGGSEDHTAMLASEASRLKQYPFCPVCHERTIDLPAGCTFAIASSGIVADKTGSAKGAYNRASLAARAILERWRSTSGSDAPTLAVAAASSPDAPDAIRESLRSAGADASRLLMRFEQFWHESESIVPRASDALARSDWRAFRDAVDESQACAEALLGNQVAETSWLVRQARALGAIASSAFGAGFGGSVWALVERDSADDFAARWGDAYQLSGYNASGRAEFFVTAAGPSATQL